MQRSLRRVTTLFTVLLLLSCNWAHAQSAPPTNLSGQELRTWLKENWYDGRHSSLGYNGARRAMYSTIDVRSDNRVYCVYSGFSQAPANTTFLDPINAEHTVPQSFFSSGAEPMRSDILHLYPTHGSVNSARGNRPFEEIPASQVDNWYSVTGSNQLAVQGSTPSSDLELWSRVTPSAFEPRDDHKGDVARAVFYFYTMYANNNAVTTTIDDVADPALLFQWHTDDPVSALEQTRNDRVENAQGNRNPYIDHPDAVGRAFGFSQGPTISVNESIANFGVVTFGNASAAQSYTVSAAALTENLTITASASFEVALTDQDASYGSTVTLTQTNGTIASTTVFARFKPANAAGGAITGTITNSSSGQSSTIAVEGVEGDPTQVDPPNSPLLIKETDSTYTIDFDNTLTNVNNGTYNGTGFGQSPAAGQIDSDAIIVNGLQDGSMDFGTDQSGNDFAKGAFGAADDVMSGGIYAFNVGSGTDDWALGIQPTSGDWTPGTITLRVLNRSGRAITAIDFSYDLYVINDGDRSNFFNFSHSADNVNYTPEPSLDYSSPEAASATDWELFPRSITIDLSSSPLADGDFYYFQWDGDGISGSGARDEFALDNISVTFNPGDPGVDPILLASAPVEGYDFGLVTAPANSEAVTYTLTTADLTGDVTITAPAPFEVSANGSGYTNTLLIGSDTANQQTISVRFAPTLTEDSTYQAEITHTTSGANAVNVPVTGRQASVTETTVTALRQAVDADGNPTTNGLVQVTGLLYGVNTNPGANTFQFAFTDGTAAINIFQGNDELSLGGFAEGDSVTMVGLVDAFNGLMQIEPQLVTLINSGNSRPLATAVTVLDESTESELVRVNQVSIPNSAQWIGGAGNTSSFNVDIVVEGVTYTMRIDSDTELAALTYNEVFGTDTSLISITGIGGQFDTSNPRTSGYQLLPYQASDIIVLKPVLNVAAGLQNFGTVSFGDASTAQSYAIDGLNLTGDVTITASESFEIATEDIEGEYTSSLTFTPAEGMLAQQVIFVRFRPSDAIGQELTGTITHSSAGVDDIVLNVVGTEFTEPFEPSTITFDIEAAEIFSDLDRYTVNLSLDKAFQESRVVSVLIPGTSANIAYGTDFVTDPAAVVNNSRIPLLLDPGVKSLSFVVELRINEPPVAEGGITRQIDFTLEDVADTLLTGTNPSFTLTIKQPIEVPTAVGNALRSNISLYPMPANNTLVVELVNAAFSIEQYTLYNREGRRMASAPLTNNRIDTSLLPQGLYVLQLLTTKGPVHYSILIQH